MNGDRGTTRSCRAGRVLDAGIGQCRAFRGMVLSIRSVVVGRGGGEAGMDSETPRGNCRSRSRRRSTRRAIDRGYRARDDGEGTRDERRERDRFGVTGDGPASRASDPNPSNRGRGTPYGERRGRNHTTPWRGRLCSSHSPLDAFQPHQSDDQLCVIVRWPTRLRPTGHTGKF